MSPEDRSPVRKLTRGRPPMSADLRRTQILRAAAQIFAEIGYANTTMEIVANRSLISKATLYTIFPGKKQLFASAVDAQSRLIIPDASPQDRSLAQLLEAMLLPDPDERGISSRNENLHAIYTDVRPIPEPWEIFRSAIEAQGRRLAVWLLNTQSVRLVAPKDVKNVARMLMDISIGFPPFHIDTPTNSETRMLYVRDFIMLLCRGIELRQSGESDRLSS